jgi:hypothetical protein
MLYRLANSQRRGAAAQPFRVTMVGIACALAVLAPAPAAAQSAKVEAAYVVIGGEGAVARAVLTDAVQCPAISIGNASQPMSIRAKPDTGNNPVFPVLVCEAAVASGATSAAIEGQALPLPKPSLHAIAVFGDTGCRLKASKKAIKRNEHDDQEAGKFQDCDQQSKWPFSRLSATVAARHPDLVVHVGDYIYRESPCPQGDEGCKGSPYGDNWQTWKADFFSPAAALLAAAPWIVTRGNHEICERAGTGFLRFLDPTLAQNETPPACTDLTPPYTATVAGKPFIVMDSSNAADACENDTCDSAPYAAQFAGLKPAQGSWFVSHRPIWGIGRNFTLNETLQQALKAWNGKLPEGIDLALAGHMHTFEMLSFADQRSPQFIIGTGGTDLDKNIKRQLAGMKIGGTTVSDGRVEREWGFTLLTPRKDGTDWTLTFLTAKGKAKFACKVERTEATCG